MPWVAVCLDYGWFKMFEGKDAKSFASEYAEDHERNHRGHDVMVSFISKLLYCTAKGVKKEDKEDFYKKFPKLFILKGKNRRAKNERYMMVIKASMVKMELYRKGADVKDAYEKMKDAINSIKYMSQEEMNRRMKNIKTRYGHSALESQSTGSLFDDLKDIQDKIKKLRHRISELAGKIAETYNRIVRSHPMPRLENVLSGECKRVLVKHREALERENRD